MEVNKIYNEDCMEGMKKLKENSIDLIVTDCPYKIIAGGIRIIPKDDPGGIFNKRPVVISDGTKCNNKWLKKKSDMVCAAKNGTMFNHNNIEFEEWLPEAYRVLKKGTHCYIMVNSRNLTNLQQEAEKVGFVFQNLLVWKKNNVTPNKYYMQQGEFVLMLSKRPARNINNMGSKNIISIPNVKNKEHPTEKPVELMEFLIMNSTNEGEIVLDMFTGVGATMIASKNNNRKFIGFEKDPEYFEIAQARTKHYVAQKKLVIE